MLTKEDIVNNLSNGYCLWVGNGIDIFLSEISGTTLPTWEEFVVKMEKTFEIQTPSFDSTFSERLEVIDRKKGRITFQRALREFIIEPFAKSILDSAKLYEDKDDLIPKQFRQLMRLAKIANPIVNFNIESITSWVLGMAGGAFKISALRNKLPHEGLLPMSAIMSRNEGDFTKNIYHPHGAIDLGGTCIMTKSDYSGQSGTLAFQLAIHQAFANDLVIVGMSLEDDYLLEQITNFRYQINRIYYFSTDALPNRLEKWMWQNDILFYKLNTWEEFWNEIADSLPAPDESRIHRAWLCAIQQSYSIFNHTDFVNLTSIGSDSSDFDLQQFKVVKLYDSLIRGIDISKIQPHPSIIEQSYRKKLWAKILELEKH